jgi:hypothetical protein
MRVRSATAEQVSQYKESMLNQDMNITFNEIKSTPETALEMEKIEQEKKNKKEKSRIQGLSNKHEYSKPTQEKTVDETPAPEVVELPQQKIDENSSKIKDILNSKPSLDPGVVPWEDVVKESENKQ